MKTVFLCVLALSATSVLSQQCGPHYCDPECCVSCRLGESCLPVSHSYLGYRPCECQYDKFRPAIPRSSSRAFSPMDVEFTRRHTFERGMAPNVPASRPLRSRHNPHPFHGATMANTHQFAGQTRGVQNDRHNFDRVSDPLGTSLQNLPTQGENYVSLSSVYNFKNKEESGKYKMVPTKPITSYKQLRDFPVSSTPVRDIFPSASHHSGSPMEKTVVSFGATQDIPYEKSRGRKLLSGQVSSGFGETMKDSQDALNAEQGGNIPRDSLLTGTDRRSPSFNDFLNPSPRSERDPGKIIADFGSLERITNSESPRYYRGPFASRPLDPMRRPFDPRRVSIDPMRRPFDPMTGTFDPRRDPLDPIYLARPRQSSLDRFRKVNPNMQILPSSGSNLASRINYQPEKYYDVNKIPFYDYQPYDHSPYTPINDPFNYNDIAGMISSGTGQHTGELFDPQVLIGKSKASSLQPSQLAVQRKNDRNNMREQRAQMISGQPSAQGGRQVLFDPIGLSSGQNLGQTHQHGHTQHPQIQQLKHPQQIQQLQHTHQLHQPQHIQQPQNAQLTQHAQIAPAQNPSQIPNSFFADFMRSKVRETSVNALGDGEKASGIVNTNIGVHPQPQPPPQKPKKIAVF